MIVGDDSCPDLGGPVTTDDEESESGSIHDSCPDLGSISDCPCDINDEIAFQEAGKF